MRKRLSKILCVAVAAATAFSVATFAGCGEYYNSNALPGSIAGEVSSNGGFAVEKGNYVYFINGVASNTDSNVYGEVEKGAIMRIAKTDLANHNYANVQTVVPMVTYSGNYDTGLYIYGDTIYFSTPSTDKNSDGVIQNQYLNFKSSKLDGTQTTVSNYLQTSTNTVEYRFVEVEGTVYLLYVANEDLAKTGTAVNNIRSVNTKTGENTLLAYNVTSYAFDKTDVENPYVYYTMAVTNYIGGGKKQSPTENYNQVYRVRADETEKREYDFSYITDRDEDSTDPIYVNCGEFVFDGIGKIEAGDKDRITQFNFNYNKTGYNIDHASYKYELIKYTDGVLYYTRTATSESLFKLADSEIDADWDAINDNPSDTSASKILSDGSAAADYTFMTVNSTEMALYVDGNYLTLAPVANGKVDKTQAYQINRDDSAVPTVLFTKEHTELGHSYIYYSIAGGNGYTINRIAYDGQRSDYEKFPVGDSSVYQSIKVLDLDASADWYKPELIENQILFASETTGMTEFNYIMACDLSNEDGEMMNNAELKAYNEKYAGIEEKIAEYSSETNSDGTSAYTNLSSALRYQFYTRDSGYLAELIQAYVDVLGKSDEYYYSHESAQKYLEFATPTATNDWADYTDTKTVNGKTVYANVRDYYYSVLGKMTESDAEHLAEHLKGDYMKDYPVSDKTWFEGLSTSAKVWFIIGVSVGGLVVLGGLALLIILLVKKFGKKMPTYSKEKIKVDVTDDKNIDVYATDETDQK